MGKGEAMTLQEKLELAAMVAGDEVEQDPNLPTYYRTTDEREPGEWREWMPHTDDGDSRRLEIACLSWIEGNIITCPETVDDAVRGLERARRSGDAEQYRAAVLDLAAAIGEAINAA